MTDTPEAVMEKQLTNYILSGDRDRVAGYLVSALKVAGYAIVPREPTEKMCKCAESNWSGFCTGDVAVSARRLYRAMLAAAEDTGQ